MRLRLLCGLLLLARVASATDVIVITDPVINAGTTAGFLVHFGQKLCSGGPRNGLLCVTAADCPGTNALPACAPAPFIPASLTYGVVDLKTGTHLLAPTTITPADPTGTGIITVTLSGGVNVLVGSPSVNTKQDHVLGLSWTYSGGTGTQDVKFTVRQPQAP